ncbi:MAG: FkbM family methyltransferase [bacterium]|nr:FkbM family methyltransferase [bacterium]
MPFSLQQELRRLRALTAARMGRLRSDEPEFDLLPRLVQPGDWVLDIGANVGEYTLRLSALAGPEGRVFAVEPVPATVEILASVIRCAPHRNVTILGVGAAADSGLSRLSVPASESGLPNYRQARITESGAGSAYCLRLDDLAFPHRIGMVKVDVEGHEDQVLDGLRHTIERDKPVLLVEGHEGLLERLAPLGYRLVPRTQGSPNILFLPAGVPDPSHGGDPQR